MELKLHPDKVGRIDGIKLPPTSIKIDPNHNIRDMASERTRAHIEELKVAIKAWGGVKDPLEVRMVGEDAFVTDGECRLTAVLELIRDENFECTSLVCIKERAGTDAMERILNFGISGTKERYSELEMAEWCRRADRAGASFAQIAAAAGWKSAESVKKHLDMLEKMTEPLKEMVRNEEVSASNVMQEIRETGTRAAEATLTEAKAIAKSEGKDRVTRKTINKTKGNAPRPRQASMPLAVNENRQGMINILGEAAKLAILSNVKDKPDDELVQVPAAFLKAARNIHLGVPLAEATATPSPPLTQAGAGPAREAPSPGDDDPAPGLSEEPRLPPAPQLQMPMRQNMKSLIEALEPFARIANDFDLNEKSDDDIAEVPLKHIKKAWIVFAGVTGQTEAA